MIDARNYAWIGARAWLPPVLSVLCYWKSWLNPEAFLFCLWRRLLEMLNTQSERLRALNCLQEQIGVLVARDGV